MSNSNPILIRKYGDNITECHLSVMSQQTTTATNRASVMHAIIHAWYMSGLISRSDHIAVSGLWTRNTAIYWSYTVLCTAKTFIWKNQYDQDLHSSSFSHHILETSLKWTLLFCTREITFVTSYSSFLFLCILFVLVTFLMDKLQIRRGYLDNVFVLFFFFFFLFLNKVFCLC